MRSSARPVTVTALLGVACAPLAPRVPPPPPPPPPSAYVTTLGVDTVFVERYTRVPGILSGQALSRTPTTRLLDFEYRYYSDGTVQRVEVVFRPADTLDAPPTGRSVLTFVNDSAVVETGIAEDARVQWIPAQRAHIVWLGFISYSMFETALQLAPADVGDSTVLSIYFPPALGGTQPFVVRRTAPDSLTMRARPMGVIRVHVDEEGRALYFDGTGSALGFTVVRDPEAPFDSLVLTFAARDALGGLGPISPRDTVRARVHGADFVIDYSRPFVRSRTIFGEVVPWGRVWRTGANAATHITVSRDVVIGALHVPAGTYTLWTLPRENEWWLIVNRQTRQWGTEYDPAFDLGRTRMEVRRLAESVEQFTIRVEEKRVGGELILTWDTYEARVPFSPR